MLARTTATALTMALALGLGAPAMAQDAGNGPDWWSGWDTDADGILSDTEFTTEIFLDDAYARMDADEDGLLSEDEIELRYMVQSTFAQQDTDGDGYLTVDELMEGIRVNYDSNGDEMLDGDELDRMGNDLAQDLMTGDM